MSSRVHLMLGIAAFAVWSWGCTSSDGNDPGAGGTTNSGSGGMGAGGTPNGGTAGNVGGAGTGGSGGVNTSGGTTAGGSGSGGTAAGAGGSSGGTGAGGSSSGGSWTGPFGPTAAMNLISRDVPAFASSSLGGSTPDKANDDNPIANWTPQTLPAWIAYDLSAVSSDERQSVLVVWNDERPGYLYNGAPSAFDAAPKDYTIEFNTGAGGGSPPSSGWMELANVTGNTRGTVQHVLELAGANWVRMSVTSTSDPAGGLFMDLDVFSIPTGPSDSWMFMGDSITAMCHEYAYSDLPQLLEDADPERYPAVIDAAIGGTSAKSAVSIVDDTMAGFPGPFVVLAYGTNDLSAEFPANMELLIQKVIAAGKVPVVPHMPWSDQRVERGPEINAAIDELYDAYPEVLHGPDLWSAFLNRSDLIPAGDLHPNDPGKEEFRAQWAAMMATVQ